MVPDSLASVCDEQLMSIGGEIALSGNKKKRKMLNKKFAKMFKMRKITPSPEKNKKNK